MKISTKAGMASYAGFGSFQMVSMLFELRAGGREYPLITSNRFFHLCAKPGLLKV